MHSLRVGDLALFLTDRYKNYLALSVDGRIYYLNHSCIPTFTQDIGTKGKVCVVMRPLNGNVSTSCNVYVQPGIVSMPVEFDIGASAVVVHNSFGSLCCYLPIDVALIKQ